MKNKLIILMLLAAGAVFAQFSVGIRIGEPPPPRVIRVQPRSPGEGYMWVQGYWYPVGHRYRWHEGYWTRPPYEAAYWVAPYHVDGRYYGGRWEGRRGYIDHDHHWDRDKERDEHRDHHKDHDDRRR